MSHITAADVTAIVSHADTIRTYARNAVALHTDAIRTELEIFDAVKKNDPVAFARRCLLSAVLSNQAELRGNLRYAYALSHYLDAGVSPNLETLRKQTRFNGMNSSVRYALAAYDAIKHTDVTTWTPADFMTLTGVGPKIARWAIAPFNPDARCITLDRHMIAFMCDIAGIGKRSAFKVLTRKSGKHCPEYDALEQMFLSIADDLNVSPFVLQWSVWNEWRHSGQHASHVELVGIDPDEFNA